jgi:hypothetical protein
MKQEQKQELGPNQKLWLETLESDKYQQGHGYLKCKREDEDFFRYCCLGVAEEIFNASISKQKPVCQYDLLGKKVEIYEFEDRIFNRIFTNSLTNDVKEKLKMRGSLGDAKDKGLFLSCVTMNDTLKFTFKEIAERIRANPEQYFRKPA